MDSIQNFISVGEPNGDSLGMWLFRILDAGHARPSAATEEGGKKRSRANSMSTITPFVGGEPPDMVERAYYIRRLCSINPNLDTVTEKQIGRDFTTPGSLYYMVTSLRTRFPSTDTKSFRALYVNGKENGCLMWELLDKTILTFLAHCPLSVDEESVSDFAYLLGERMQRLPYWHHHKDFIASVEEILSSIPTIAPVEVQTVMCFVQSMTLELFSSWEDVDATGDSPDDQLMEIRKLLHDEALTQTIGEPVAMWAFRILYAGAKASLTSDELICWFRGLCQPPTTPSSTGCELDEISGNETAMAATRKAIQRAEAVTEVVRSCEEDFPTSDPNGFRQRELSKVVAAPLWRVFGHTLLAYLDTCPPTANLAIAASCFSSLADDLLIGVSLDDQEVYLNYVSKRLANSGMDPSDLQRLLKETRSVTVMYFVATSADEDIDFQEEESTELEEVLPPPPPPPQRKQEKAGSGCC